MDESEKGTVIVISSHVVRGTVGNRAAVFALETLGHPVWALPTVILPWHPGHGRATRVSISAEDFDAIISDLIRAPWRGEVKAVLSGYLGSAAQARSVARLVESLRADNPDLIYMCDPVCGDDRGLYVPEETAVAIRDSLIPLASVATPNRFELAWLTGAPLETNGAIIDAALSLGPPRMLLRHPASIDDHIGLKRHGNSPEDAKAMPPWRKLVRRRRSDISKALRGSRDTVVSTAP